MKKYSMKKNYQFILRLEIEESQKKTKRNVYDRKSKLAVKNNNNQNETHLRFQKTFGYIVEH